MKRSEYVNIENYMWKCMTDSAHDREHIYRVLYTALDIAGQEKGVDTDLLITACLLHDIGRQEQFDNPKLCHAAVGAQKAQAFLLQTGYDAGFAEAVASCIQSHRYRENNPPQSIEAKILFDADKVDVTGALGIARTILYKGQVGEPLYTRGENGEILDGSADAAPSFFQEYRWKLEGLYGKFYTKRGQEIALSRQPSAKAFYESMLQEVRESCQTGEKLLRNFLF